jgi:hypothetical protein
MKLVLTAITVVAMTISVGAQWLNHPTPGIPRTADGKANLTAAAPRAVDGKPDLTSLWTRRPSWAVTRGRWLQNPTLCS